MNNPIKCSLLAKYSAKDHTHRMYLHLQTEGMPIISTQVKKLIYCLAPFLVDKLIEHLTKRKGWGGIKSFKSLKCL